MWQQKLVLKLQFSILIKHRLDSDMWRSEKHKIWGLILSYANKLINLAILLDKPLIFWWTRISELSSSTSIPIPLWVISIKITVSWPSILLHSFWCSMIKFISFTSTFTFLTSCACYWSLTQITLHWLLFPASSQFKPLLDWDYSFLLLPYLLLDLLCWCLPSL